MIYPGEKVIGQGLKKQGKPAPVSGRVAVGIRRIAESRK
jgi:hypothetical protein